MHLNPLNPKGIPFGQPPYGQPSTESVDVAPGKPSILQTTLEALMSQVVLPPDVSAQSGRPLK